MSGFEFQLSVFVTGEAFESSVVCVVRPARGWCAGRGDLGNALGGGSSCRRAIDR